MALKRGLGSLARIRLIEILRYRHYRVWEFLYVEMPGVWKCQVCGNAMCVNFHVCELQDAGIAKCKNGKV